MYSMPLGDNTSVCVCLPDLCTGFLPCIASADKIHAVQWIDAYPDAKSYVCPGGMKKYPDVNYTQVSTHLCHMHIV